MVKINVIPKSPEKPISKIKLAPTASKGKKNNSKKGIIVSAIIIVLVLLIFASYLFMDRSSRELSGLAQLTSESTNKVFSGTIGDKKMIMELKQVDGKIEGRYFYYLYGKWIALKQVASNGNKVMLEESYNNETTGFLNFIEVEDDGEIGGLWFDKNKEKSRVFDMQTILCDNPELNRLVVDYVIAQNHRNIAKVIDAWSLTPARYYNNYFPTKDKIKTVYTATWENLTYSQNDIVEISNLVKNQVELKVEFSFSTRTAPETVEKKSSLVYFTFNNEGEIVSEAASN